MPEAWVSPDEGKPDRVCIVYYQTPYDHVTLPPGKQMTYMPGDPMPAFLVEKGVTQSEWDEILTGIQGWTDTAQKESRLAFCCDCCLPPACNPCKLLCYCTCMCICLVVLTKPRVEFEQRWSEKLGPKDLELSAGSQNLTACCSLDGCCMPEPEVYYFMIQPKGTEDTELGLEDADESEKKPHEAPGQQAMGS